MDCYESRKDCRFMTCIIKFNIRSRQQMNVASDHDEEFYNHSTTIPRMDSSGDGGGANSSK